MVTEVPSTFDMSTDPITTTTELTTPLLSTLVTDISTDTPAIWDTCGTHYLSLIEGGEPQVLGGASRRARS